MIRVNYYKSIQVNMHLHSIGPLKGKFPKQQCGVGEYIESNFTNPTVTVWADLDNPFNISDYAKLCMSPSLDVTLPEYVISQEDNSPLTLYTLYIFTILNFSWISIVLLITFIHKCIHIYVGPNITKYKRRWKIHFQEQLNFVNICVQFH